MDENPKWSLTSERVRKMMECREAIFEFFIGEKRKPVVVYEVSGFLTVKKGEEKIYILTDAGREEVLFSNVKGVKYLRGFEVRERFFHSLSKKDREIKLWRGRAQRMIH